MFFGRMMALLYTYIQVQGVIADCIDKQTAQLKIGDELKIGHTLGSLLRLNNSFFELCFAIPSSPNCTIKVCLVDGNGNVTDISTVDCRKLYFPA